MPMVHARGVRRQPAVHDTRSLRALGTYSRRLNLSIGYPVDNTCITCTCRKLVRLMKDGLFRCWDVEGLAGGGRS